MAWRAWDTFYWCIIGAFGLFLAALATSVAMRLTGGVVTVAEAHATLMILYLGAYPLVFIALGSLLWHFVRTFRGDYASH